MNQIDYNFLRKTSNAIVHFTNEQLRDAVERLEDKPQSDLAISTHAKIHLHADGAREVFWKGKAIILIRVEKIAGRLEIVAYHRYDGFDDSITLDEFNTVDEG